MKELVFCKSTKGLVSCIPDEIKKDFYNGMRVDEIRSNPKLIKYAESHPDCGLYIAYIEDNECYLAVETGGAEFCLVSDGKSIYHPETNQWDFHDILSQVDFHLTV